VRITARSCMRAMQRKLLYVLQAMVSRADWRLPVTTETSRMHMVLFGMQNRMFWPLFGSHTQRLQFSNVWLWQGEKGLLWPRSRSGCSAAPVS
jgi:hypothetical protein